MISALNTVPSKCIKPIIAQNTQTYLIKNILGAKQLTVNWIISTVYIAVIADNAGVGFVSVSLIIITINLGIY